MLANIGVQYLVVCVLPHVNHLILIGAANIGAQNSVIRSYNSGALDILISVAAGTGVGLIVKYILDKRYIFRFRARNAVHDVRIFALYTLMGLATTVIFWGFEFGFHRLFETNEMRYLGGVIGLTIGYLTKYRLDRRYVFRPGGV
ncbi:GtrA family protein [Candidatus Methylospira mobilis]|uniref:GtrA family protein n=2 Tax=Candidatus Methylospira mobilis TaxID=1808979 RepID=A0A5Q0BLT2_9GAMM|nr:GtrA family protein [Candidatus Methylospira mobilis]